MQISNDYGYHILNVNVRLQPRYELYDWNQLMSSSIQNKLFNVLGSKETYLENW